MDAGPADHASGQGDGEGERVVVVAPVGRDAAVIAQMLGRAGIAAECCASVDAAAARCAEPGVGAALLAEEALTPAGVRALLEVLARQAPWSDLPVLVLTTAPDRARGGHDALAALEARANVTLIERPVQVRTLVAAVAAAVRARRRQYQARALIAREQEARRAAEAANRLKDDFMGTVSHELRTPLTAIVGWTRMLIDGGLAADKQARALATIDRNARAQVQLIEELLDFSRILSGKVRLEPGPVDLAQVAAHALDSARPTAELKGVRLDEPDLAAAADATVLGDPDRLQQVVWNLLANAVKFTPPGGRVVLAVRREGPGVVLSVADTGQGIEPSFLPLVFERFRQADSGIARAHGGLGLGLAIVKHLVELHGGTVDARSEGVGRGACFEVRLPAVNTRGDAAARAAAVVAASSPAQPARGELVCPPELAGLAVLVVDDEPDARELVTGILAHCGARVTAAGSAHEALAVLERSAIDVLVSDLGMPGETGLELIRAVRARPSDQGARLPAVALTAYARAQDRAHSLAAGFDRHVPKPVEPAELVRAVAGLSARRA